MTAMFTLHTTVGEPHRAMVIAAARQLSAAVSTASGREWPVRLVLREPEGAAPEASIWIVSMIDDARSGEAIEAITDRWLARHDRWTREGEGRVLMTTLFRNVPRIGPVSVERLRRLNRTALWLSREAGFEIVDIDRIFGWCGARTLATDYRCAGEAAAEVGGHAIATAILEGTLANEIPPEIQEAATRLHGGVFNIAAIMAKRMPS